jgi:hypothetical protein
MDDHRGWRIAVHESGHCVAARLLKLRCGGACFVEPFAEADCKPTPTLSKADQFPGEAIWTIERVACAAVKGAPRLPGDPNRSREARAALLALEALPAAALIVREATTLGDVAKAYLASDKFMSRAERTQSDYRRLIDARCAKFRRMPAAALHENPDETRGDFLDWRDELSKRSKRQADYAWSALNVVLNWGKQRGRLKLNPCRDAGVEGLYEGTRRDKVWTNDNVEAFSEAASAEVRFGLMLAYWTGQRQGDLLRLPWSGYDGDLITLTQSKGGVEVGVPVAAPLKALLAATPRKSPIMMVNQGGQPNLIK